MKKILTEPLLHFLLLGLGLFLVYEWITPEQADTDNRIIVVDRQALLTFIQFRSRAFEPEAAVQLLDSLTVEERERLITDFVREEALYRQAQALGVAENDYVIKRRMIQSVEFITNGFVTAGVAVTEDDVARYFAENRELYRIRPYATFTHVFFSHDLHGKELAASLAADKLTELNSNAVPFGDATRHGDKFPFFVNYVERDPEFVAGHFGTSMATEIFSLEPDAAQWRGPLESAYGQHLVLIARIEPERYPQLAEVADRVRRDAERADQDVARAAAIQAIVDTYEIRLQLDEPGSAGP